MILIQPFAKKLRSGKVNPKNYPYWKELLSKIDEPVIQLGVEGEEQLVEDFRKSLPLTEIKKLLEECRTFIAIDSFLQHLAWYVGKPGVVLWGQGNPEIFGHPEHTNLLKDPKYLRVNQFATWEEAEANDEAFVSPEQVLTSLQKYGL